MGKILNGFAKVLGAIAVATYCYVSNGVPYIRNVEDTSFIYRDGEFHLYDPFHKYNELETIIGDEKIIMRDLKDADPIYVRRHQSLEEVVIISADGNSRILHRDDVSGDDLTKFVALEIMYNAAREIINGYKPIEHNIRNTTSFKNV